MQRSQTKPERRRQAVERARGASGRTSNPEPVASLHTRYSTGDLVVYLGAGVALSAGLPGWEELLHRLTVEMWRERLGGQVAEEDAEAWARLFRRTFGGFPIISGRYIRQALGGRFEERVRAILYSNPHPVTELLLAVTRLCVPPPGAVGVRAIVSYNYDDLVEAHLAECGVGFHSIFAEGQSPCPDELPVYHVHGYLPRHGSLDRHSEIVFAEDAYHTQFLDPYGWANITQLNLMRERTGLFVGLSMTDPNLRRLLDVAHRHNPEARHCVVLKSPSEQETAPEDGKESVSAPPDAFARASRAIQEDALADLGLRVLWVERYEEVPAVLDRIRTGE